VVAEHQLVDAARSFRAVFDATADGILLSDPDSLTVVEANPAACTMFGYDRDELIGLGCSALVHPDSYAEWRRRSTEEHLRMSLLGRRRDGSTVHVLLNTSSTMFNGRPTRISVVHETTQEVRARAQLEARVAERTGELNALLDVSQALGGTLEQRPLLSLILNRLLSVVPCSEAFIMLVEGDELCIVEYRGPQSREQMLALRTSIAEAPAFEAIMGERGPVVVGDVHGDNPLAVRWRSVLDRGRGPWPIPFRSILAVPLTYKERVIGQIRLDHVEPNFYQSAHRELVLTIANQAAVAIEHARLFEQERLARERLEVAVAAGRMGTWEWDIASGRVTWSTQLEAIHGVPTGTFGGTFEAYLADIHPEDRAHVQQTIGQSLQTGEHQLEYRVLWPDGSVHWLAASGRAIRGAHGQPIGMRGVCQDITSRKLAEFERDRLVESEHAASEARAALEERQRLARELHDSVSQALYGIALGTQTIAAALNEDSDTRAATEATHYVVQLAESAITEMRALIFALRPESLEQEGLVVALERHVASLRAQRAFDVDAQFDTEPELPLDHKEALYRIAHEALHNAARHARPRVIRIRLSSSPEVILEVADDGMGFDASAPHPGHLGLTSMRERASLIQSQLSIDSEPGRGTRVTVRVPRR
jgi:PAS domain S-box-containing protein